MFRYNMIKSICWQVRNKNPIDDIDVDMLVIFRSSWRCWLHVQPSLQNAGFLQGLFVPAEFVNFFPNRDVAKNGGQGSAWTLSRNLRREAPGAMSIYGHWCHGHFCEKKGKFGKIWLVVTGTWLDYDFPYIGNVIIPTDELHHFSER
jgi:hypothetical protein